MAKIIERGGIFLTAQRGKIPCAGPDKSITLNLT